MEMQWEDPPPPVSVTHWRSAFVASLRSHPGKWAKVTNPVGKTEFADSSMPARFKDLGAEVAMRRVEGTNGSRFNLWARWPEQGG